MHGRIFGGNTSVFVRRRFPAVATLGLGLALAGCAGGNYAMETVPGPGGDLGLRGSNNVLASHSFAGKKRPGDGVVSLNPRYHRGLDATDRFQLEISHEYRRPEHAFGSFDSVLIAVNGGEPRAYVVEESETTSREVKTAKGGGWFEATLWALGEYDRAECRMQSVYVCQEDAPPTEEDLWRTHLRHRETGTISLSRAELRRISRAKSLRVSIAARNRSQTFTDGRVPFVFKPNLRRFLDSVKTIRESQEKATARRNKRQGRYLDSLEAADARDAAYWEARNAKRASAPEATSRMASLQPTREGLPADSIGAPARKNASPPRLDREGFPLGD